MLFYANMVDKISGTIVLSLSLLIGFSITFDEKVDWAVEIEGNEELVKEIAKRTNFEYLGRVGNLDNIYHFQVRSAKGNRSKRSIEIRGQLLQSHQDIKWVEEQTTLIRQKRDYSINSIDDKVFTRRDLETRIVKNMFNDPKWPEEWYIYDSRALDENEKFDMQVVPVWHLNITGRGVKLTIIDDGIEHSHPDLKDNYDPLCSTDLNDNDNDPTPNTAPGTSNEHGTRCASEISMSANNNFCGVGIAYDSKIGGIRILDGRINDLIEAKALGFNNHHIDIYSASWGPTDNGKTMEKPGKLAGQALVNGIQLGRQGKGSIYVWASGNGGYFDDSCSCDGYTSSIYVISVGSISAENTVPRFAEKCPSTMCVTYSTSTRDKNKLIVADVRGICNNQHSGTSASAPYAAGIFALALEANPNLTWRDIKHLVAWTSQSKLLKSSNGWKKNCGGFWVNRRFGFGLLNAFKLVTKAKFWNTVPNFKNCTIHAKLGSRTTISNTEAQKIIVNGRKCSTQIKFIENVIVRTTITYPKRGALLITLRSPCGMNTTLLSLRQYDNDNKGLRDWPLNSVHNWGETPNGNWKVFIEDKRQDDETREGRLVDLSLEFHGMSELPHHVKVAHKHRRQYDDDEDIIKD